MWAAAGTRFWTDSLPETTDLSEEALILAPLGRDASVAARMLAEAGIASRICADVVALARELAGGAGLAMVTEEALASADLRPVTDWLAGQPEWSDLPFVLLTHRGGGLERNPRAQRALALLGNVTFVERPFHPTTLVSLARSALRARRRQYEARTRLDLLQESERQFRDLADSIPTLCWSAGPDGSVTWYNQRWYDYTGADPAGMAGWGWGAVHDPQVLPVVVERWSEAISTGLPFEMVFPLRGADGRFRPFLTRSQPVRDAAGRVVRWFGTSTDISAQQEAEERLRDLNDTLERRVAEAAADLDRVWRNAGDIFVVIDGEGVFRRVNPAATAILGWREDELLGRGVFDFVHPDDIALTRAALEHARVDVLPTVENRYRGKDGRYRTISWVAAPEGELIYAYGRDVTAEREREAELAAAQDALRQAQKMEAIGQLTGGVAHDFNNLLTVIRGSVDLLRRPGLSDEKRRTYVDAIGSTADRAAKLTAQLLAFARRQSLNPEPFDAGESLTEVAGIVRTLIGSRIRLDLDFPADPVWIRADRGQFDTAIVNLAINSRDAMDGEGVLSIRLQPVSGIPALRGHAPVDGDFVAIAIADTGTGIAPDDAERIFEPFFTTKEVGAGTGLGLSQVIGFAKQSGGDVRVTSPPGEGATFTLYLPRVRPDRNVASDVEASGPAGDGEGLCVLVVEDNEQVGVFATEALRELGYDSVLVPDAARALAELGRASDRFHIVFSDVVMPGMGGVELAGEIRQRHPHVPVVLTSGYSHVLAQEGTHGFELLRKPYSVEQLSRVLQHASSHAATPHRAG
jgi:PAS domain S-box-containing protein